LDTRALRTSADLRRYRTQTLSHAYMDTLL